MGILYKLFGIGGFKAKMKSLPLKIQKQVLRAVVRAGVTVIKKQFKANLKKARRTGLTEKAVAVKVKLYKGMVLGMVGVNKGTTRIVSRFGKIRPGNYNHLIELGRNKFKRVWYNKKKRQKLKKPKWIKAARGTYPLKNAIASTRGEVKSKMETVFKNKMAAINATIDLGEYTA